MEEDDKKNELEELQQSKDFLDSLIENIPDMIFVKEAKELRFLRFNRAGEELLGVPRNELFGKNDYDFFPHEQADFFTKKDRDVLSAKTLVEIPEEPIETRHRGKRLLRTKKIPVLDRQGNPLYLLGISEDITEKRAIEAELKAAKEAAEAASRAKSAFLANMSHEIRTPMNGIVGMLEILAETALTTEQKEYVGTIRACSDSLLYIINDILDFSKIEAGKLEFHDQSFNLSSELTDTVAVFSVAAKERKLELHLQLDEQAPHHVIGDRHRLRQVLANLISNSVKFTEEGGEVRIRASLERMEHDRGIFRFSVCDTGIGIDDELMKEIFNPFTQGDTSYTRMFGGTGLGLSISYRLVALMNGKLEVRSERGTGSEFYFSLPLRLDSSVAVGGSTSADVSPKAHSAMAQRRILLAEDNAVNIRVARKILESAGHTVTIAQNGQEVLELFEKGEFDLILMDIQMPVLDGYSTARAIRNLERERNAPRRIPIFALTAHAMEGDRARCFEAGMDDYLTKPLSKPLLLERLERL